MSTARRLRHRATALTMVVSLAVAGCGVPSQTGASRTPPEDVPFGLLRAPSPTAGSATGRPIDLYLVRGDRLVPVERTVAPTATIATVLRALSAGPTAAEQELGIGSPLPPGQVEGVEVVRGVAVVDLKGSFGDLPSDAQTVAIGQIVYTLTGRPGIGSVAFTLDGQSIEVPGSGGALTGEALARDDFSDLAPR